MMEVDRLTRWNSRGHRGDVLEDLILFSNETILKNGLGRIDKIHVPIKVIEIDSKGMITKAFFEKKSTVDFMGVIQGIPVAFDVKETNLKSLPLQNIHEHQLEFMSDFSSQKGLSFIMIHFKFCDEYFIVPYELVNEYYHSGKRRSIPYRELPEKYRIDRPSNGILNYLTAVKTYIMEREKGTVI
jgi:recombination protein U